MNAYCNLFIYKNCKILKGKNFKVDSISDYLATCVALNKTENGVLTAIQGQFMKHQFKLTYVIELGQTDIDGSLGRNGRGQELLSYEDAFNYNYLVAENIDTYLVGANVRTKGSTKVYYFIVGKKWMSDSSIQLELEMDVINTLIGNTFDGNTLELSDKTTIIRQHKNRWKKGTSPNKNYFPVIDLYSEGIQTPLFKISEKSCYPIDLYQNFDDSSYYLIYIASSEGNDKPIDIYLTADEGLVVNQTWTAWSGTFNASSELRTKYYGIIYGSDGASGLTNIGCTITFYENTSPKTQRTFTITSSNQCIIIRNSSIQWGVVASNGWTMTSGILNMSISDRKKIQISGLAKMRVANRSDFALNSTISTLTDSYITNLPIASDYAPSQQGNKDVIGISDVDRTNGRIAKIVKLPYCPIDIEHNSDGTINLPSEWEVASWPIDAYLNAIHYRFLNEPSCFVSNHILESLNFDLTEPFDIIMQRQINTFGDIVARNKDYETKLLHSDYFIQKFVYDSFAYNFRCEFMDDVDGATALSVKMATTSSMTSNFFFTFPLNVMKIDNEDYSNLMMVSRNNEVILYNSSYLDYIRNGYNFDKKTRNRNLALSIASLGLNTISDVAGMVAGSGGKSKAEMIAGAVQFGAKTINSTLSIIGHTAQADQNIEQKLRASLYQGVSVAGSDDLDLLSEYAVDNKPKMVVYKISEKMEKSLFDLFYYTGYVANFQGIPDTSSRMWFNFVMADPVFKYEQNFSEELLDALTQKYNEGITFLHKVVQGNSNLWDFEQQYENWEMSILPIPAIFEVPADQPLLANREYVIKQDLSSATNIGRITNSGKLTWRKRRKSNLEILESLSGLDTITVNGLSTEKKLDVRTGSSINKEVSFSDYASADYYWTIEFSANSGSSGYNQSIVYNAIFGYIYYR